MLILEARHLTMHFGDKTLFTIEDLRVDGGDRIGLIGPNGAGKTTLLTVLAGLREPVSGSAFLHTAAAYIPQMDDGDRSADDLPERQRDDWGIPPTAYSGGEQTRLRIARALGRESGLLLCDEPTANLDEEGAAKLEDALIHYAGALIVVSHDRALLDRLCNRIWELEDGTLTQWRGNYSAWRVQKDAVLQRRQALYEAYTREKKHLERAIADRSRKAAAMKEPPRRMGNSEARLHRQDVRTRQAKVGQSAAALKNRLARLEPARKPHALPDIRMEALAGQGPGSRIAITVQHLCYGYEPRRPVLRDISFQVPTGARVALLGGNGSGKTTLLRCIASREPGVRLAPGADIGYFAQDHGVPDLRRTALVCVMDGSGLSQSEVRTVLARLGLRREEVHKKTAALSGGERCRVQLARLLAGRSPVLLLDEPTNYLDVYALEALEDMLAGFSGTLLFVSHDRYFREKVATAALTLDGGRLAVEPARPAAAGGVPEARMVLELEKTRLLSRISAPDPGDRPEELETRYEEVCARLRALDEASDPVVTP